MQYIHVKFVQSQGKCFHSDQRFPLTRVDLSVIAHAISVHNVLEARGKLVGPYLGGGSVVGGDTIDKRGNGRSTFSLKY